MSFYGNNTHNGGQQYSYGTEQYGNNGQFYGNTAQNQYSSQYNTQGHIPTMNQGSSFMQQGYMSAATDYSMANSTPGITRNPDEVLPEGLLNALSTKGYSDEVSLMDELGINFDQIWNNTKKSILIKNKDQHQASDEVDLAGPLFFVILFGALLYFYSGKLHFGYIYGVGMFGTVSIHVLLKLMSNNHNALNNNANSDIRDPQSEQGLFMLQTCSILGYSFLPLCILSIIAMFVNLNTTFGLAISAFSVVWCAVSSSGQFTKSLNVHNVRLLVAYPLFIFYSIFASMVVFG
ncbi:hypothetical protein ACO0OE_001582 [Hanseniaspora uvarum]